jgi:hypothetical protein
VNLFWIVLLWSQGVLLARRQQEYYTACARFDVGLRLFSCLFLAKLVMQLKGVQPAGCLIGALSPAVLFFGLSSIGVVRIERGALREFLPGYQGLGIIVSFFAVVLLCSGGVVLFFLSSTSRSAPRWGCGAQDRGRASGSGIPRHCAFCADASMPPGMISLQPQEMVPTGIGSVRIRRAGGRNSWKRC